jgi:membrane protein DedA with SNARE-associated domain
MFSNLDPSSLLTQIQHYGSGGLFLLLALGIIGLPIPDETLLLLSGILVASHKIALTTTWLAAIAGAIVGISTSYILGRTLGHFAVLTVLKKLGINQAHWHNAYQKFNRFGKWLLFIGYFIPGVRHFTGLIAGTTELPFRQFALFAYTGALCWSNLFFWLGYFYGLNAIHFIMDNYARYDVWILLPIVILALTYIGIKRK